MPELPEWFDGPMYRNDVRSPTFARELRDLSATYRRMRDAVLSTQDATPLVTEGPPTPSPVPRTQRLVAAEHLVAGDRVMLARADGMQECPVLRNEPRNDTRDGVDMRLTHRFVQVRGDLTGCLMPDGVLRFGSNVLIVLNATLLPVRRSDWNLRGGPDADHDNMPF